jgi:hypothetical protein
VKYKTEGSKKFIDQQASLDLNKAQALSNTHYFTLSFYLQVSNQQYQPKILIGAESLHHTTNQQKKLNPVRLRNEHKFIEIHNCTAIFH